MKSIIPLEHELSALVANRLGVIVRPVKPQPPKDHPYLQECFPDGWWWNDGEEDRDDLSFWPSYDKPLYAPFRHGETLAVKEAFDWTTGNLEGRKVYYRADGGNPPSGRWTAARQMAIGDCRHFLTVESVRCVQAKELSEVDFSPAAWLWVYSVKRREG